MLLCTYQHSQSVFLPVSRSKHQRASSGFFYHIHGGRQSLDTVGTTMSAERSHWPTYNKNLNHAGLNSLLNVADHRVYRSSYSSTEVTLILAAGNATQWRGQLRRIQSILLLTQQAAINLDTTLSSLVCQREIYYNQRAVSPFLPIVSPPSFIFTPLSLPFSFPPLPAPFPSYISSFYFVRFLPPHQCHQGSSTHHSHVVTHWHSSVQVLIKPTVIYSWHTFIK